jgi:predicted metalloprotease with PDZ domain
MPHEPGGTLTMDPCIARCLGRGTRLGISRPARVTGRARRVPSASPRPQLRLCLCLRQQPRLRRHPRPQPRPRQQPGPRPATSRLAVRLTFVRLTFSLCLAWVVLAALAGAQTAAAATTPPAPGAARYVLRRVPSSAGSPARLAVELHVRGDDDGSSDFSVPPDWGGVQHLAGLLHDLAFRTEDGASLPAEPLGDRGWRIAHSPGVPLVASWWLGGAHATGDGHIGNDYAPQVTDTLVHLMGSAGLLRPDALAGGGHHHFELRWEGFSDAGLHVVSSFGEGDALDLDETLDDFCNAVFLGGALRVLHRAVGGGGQLLLAFGGETLGFADDAFADLAARIVGAERAFFDDPGDPLFTITIIPAPAPDPNSISLGGTGLTRSFALFVSPRMSLAPGSDDAMRLSALLAHEHFHHWNGSLTRSSGPQGSSYWFSEGFTDFFTRRLLVRSGVWSVAQFLTAWNETLAAWWTNPARDAPNERIVHEFWSDRGVSQLPYQRGALVALLLDRELRRASDGRLSLDDFLRDVVARSRGRAREPLDGGGSGDGVTAAGATGDAGTAARAADSAGAGEPADTENLLAHVALWTSPAFAQRLRAIIVDGASPELDADLLAPALTLQWIAMRIGSPDAALQTVPRLVLADGVDEAAARATL